MPEAKVAIVTGAGRGIGRDIALRLAREGYACGLIARTKSQLDETADLIRQAGGKAVVTPTDVSKREQVVASVETVERELGPIAVLINNAGAYLRKPFVEITEEDFDFQLKVNCYGPFFCTQAVVGRDGGARRRHDHFRARIRDRAAARCSTRPTTRRRWRNARWPNRWPMSSCIAGSTRSRSTSMVRSDCRA